jgi:hypothetical protein
MNLPGLLEKQIETQKSSVFVAYAITKALKIKF